MKKEKRVKSEKVYLKKGYYPLNDIYYDIFLSSNKKHYFSFVNNQGRTVLLNGNIKGFETLKEAELVIVKVLKFALQKENFEIITAKDGKLFFNLNDDNGEKIAKSFFFRKREDLENSLNEFILGKPSTKFIAGSNVIHNQIKETKEANIIPIANNLEKEEEKVILPLKSKINTLKEIKEQQELADKKWEEEKKILQIEKEKKAKEIVVLLATKKQKREEEKIRNQNARLEAAKINSSKNPMKDDDLFDGCFRWLWFILALLFLALVLSYFKGCFGDLNNSTKNVSENNGMVDSLEYNGTFASQDSLSTENTAKSMGSEDGPNSTNTKSGNSISRNTNLASTVHSEVYQNSIKEIAPCRCSTNAIVFKIPTSAPKNINRLGTKPQFGNTHGLSSADFLEELKYKYQNNSGDRSYLDYLYKAMGYKGFRDAQASHFSQEKLVSGTKGILGFGTYNGFEYSQLDLSGKDLELFRIEAANGCHINFMKTGGNLFYTCR